MAKASLIPTRMAETDPGQRPAHDWSDYTIKFAGEDDEKTINVTLGDKE